jgi:predicted nuclease of predicted toxin-antitoxin system
MKLLFDQNLSFKLCHQLVDVFPGSSQARVEGLEQASDRVLWDHAGRNQFVLVSLDADFAEMASLLGPPPKVIWLRCGNQPTAMIERMLREHAEAIAAFDENEAACLELY